MRTTTLEERFTFLTLAEAGHKDVEIAQRTGWSVKTVRKWRLRGQRQGRQGLVSKMGRPVIGALKTFCPMVEERLRAWRQAHPGWGAVTLRAELEADESLKDEVLPSRSSIARWLKQAELTRSYERHQDLPQSTSAPAQAAHEEWELDARGYEKIPEVGVVALLNLNDRFSKVKLLSYPCLLGKERASRHPSTEDYQLVMRLAASEWGLPDRLFVDRDSVFYDNGSQSPFPTRFHLWLLTLAIELVIGPPHRPQKRGLTERSHQTWDQQVLTGQTFAAWEALRIALQRRRDFMNERLPCSTLGNQPPLVACPQAYIPRRLYRPEWEADLMDLAPVYTYLAQGRWFRKGSNIGAVSLGNQRYNLGKAWTKKDVEITFDSEKRLLVFYSPKLNQTQHLPPKGISKADLMGELSPWIHLPHFQLALPFSWDEWRMTRLIETLVTRLIET
jgi:transposase